MNGQTMQQNVRENWKKQSIVKDYLKKSKPVS